MSTTPRNPYFAPVLAAALVIAAGIGGGLWALVDRPQSVAEAESGSEAERAAAAAESEAEAERRWASRVCGAISGWHTDLGTAVRNVSDAFDFTEPAASWEVFTANVADAEASTKTLIADLRSVEFPDTPDGQAIGIGIDALLDHATSHVEAISVHVAAIGGDLDLLDGLDVSDLIDESRALMTDARTDIEALREPAGKLLVVLRADPNCAAVISFVE